MVKKSSNQQRQHGFTLLEAVVAIAVLALGGSALYAWVNSNLKTLQRIDIITERASLISSATELLSTIDPLEQPEGSIQLGDSIVSWTTSAAEYQAPMRADDGSLGVNDASLFQAKVEIHRQQRLVAQFDMWLLGLHKAREVSDVLFD